MNEIDFLSFFEENGISLTDQKYKNLIKFEELLVDWNKVMNLTAIIEHNDIWIKHFYDSIVSTKYINFSNSKIIDLGTGAGFPGIPLKIFLPEVEISLADSLNKRIEFIKKVIETIQLKKITTIHSRAEDLGNDCKYRENYDYVVSRAVASLNVLAEYCLPLIKVGGYFVSYKGPECEKEIKSSNNALDFLGGKICDIIKYELPIEGSGRNLVIIKKVRSTPLKYPRKPSFIKRNPL